MAKGATYSQGVIHDLKARLQQTLSCTEVDNQVMQNLLPETFSSSN
jgi:hypothetical protein